MAYGKRKLNRRASRRNFRRGNGVHPRNITSNPMRGGIRL